MTNNGLTFLSDNTLLLIALFLEFIFSCWTLHRLIHVFDLRRLTIPGFWFISYCLMIFFPSPFVAFDHQGPYVITYLIAVGSVLITVPVGMALANKIFGFRTKEITEYFERPLEKAIPNTYFSFIYFLLVFFALLFTILYLIDAPTLPILFLVSNPGEQATVLGMREEAHSLLDSRFTYIYYVLKSFLYPFLVSVAYGCYLYTKKKQWLLVFCVLLGIALFYASLLTSKSQVAIIFLMICLSYYFYKRGRVGKKFLIVAVIMLVSFPMSIYYLLYPEGGVALMLKNYASRLFLSPAESAYYYFEVFPDKVDYLGGRSIGKLSWLLGLEFFPVTEYIAHYIYDFTINYGSSNAVFIADAFANFGIIGVISTGILAGFIMQTVQIFVLRRPKTIVSVALYTFLIVAFWMLNSTSLQVTLLTDGVVFSIITYYMIGLCTRLAKDTFDVSVAGCS